MKNNRKKRCRCSNCGAICKRSLSIDSPALCTACTDEDEQDLKAAVRSFAQVGARFVGRSAER